ERRGEERRGEERRGEERRGEERRGEERRGEERRGEERRGEERRGEERRGEERRGEEPFTEYSCRDVQLSQLSKLSSIIIKFLALGDSHHLVHLLSEKESQSVVLTCEILEVELPLEYNGKESFHSD
ncbi:unnamed protein product, partial [Bubo scandiacus]